MCLSWCFGNVVLPDWRHKKRSLLLDKVAETLGGEAKMPLKVAQQMTLIKETNFDRDFCAAHPCFEVLLRELNPLFKLISVWGKADVLAKKSREIHGVHGCDLCECI